MYTATILLLSGCTTIQIPAAEQTTLVPLFPQPSREYIVGENANVISDLFELNESSNPVRDSLRKCTFLLKSIDEKRNAIILKYDGKVFERILNGRFTDGQFVVRTKVQVGSFPPVIWVLGTRSDTFCRNSEDQLLIYHHKGGVVFLTMIPVFGTSGGQIKAEFN